KNPKGWVAWGHRDTSTKSCPGHSLYPLLEHFNMDDVDDDEMSPEDRALLNRLHAMFDQEEPSKWARASFDDLIARGILTTDDEPGAPLSYERMVVFLKRVIDRFDKAA